MDSSGLEKAVTCEKGKNKAYKRGNGSIGQGMREIRQKKASPHGKDNQNGQTKKSGDA